MSFSVYLNFGGDCKQALDFYCEVFKQPMPPIMKFGDAEDTENMTPEDMELVMYADLNINGTNVMFGDVPSFMNEKLDIGNNVAIYLGYSDINEVKRLYNELLAGGEVVMELQETFWSKAYGYVIDKFGVPWMVGHEQAK